MPDINFPTEAFIQAEKYKAEQEQAQSPFANIGQGLGAGIQTGFQQAYTQKANERILRQQLIQDAMKNYMFIDENTGQHADPMQIATSFIQTGTLPQNIKAKSIKEKDDKVYRGVQQPSSVPTGFEVTKYDEYGRPVIEKIKPSKQEEDVASKVERATTAREESKAATKAKSEYIAVKSGYDESKKQLDQLTKLNENTYSGSIEGLGYKAKQMTGLGTKDPKFQNTTNVVNQLRNYVARTLKSTFGGQLSDSERSYLDEVYGAAPKLTIEERRIAIDNIKRMLDLKLSQTQNAYEMWGGKIGTGQPKSVIPMAQPQTLPQGITEEDIQYTMKKYNVSRDEVINRLGAR